MYPPKHIFPKSMDWLPTQFDPIAIFAWCGLTGEFGKPLMAFVGFGGTLFCIRSLWTMPSAADTTIITIRNRQRRYRTWTIFLGWVALVLFSTSIPLYFRSANHLRAIERVCEIDHAPHDAAIATVPFLVVTVLAVLCFAWFQARTLPLKNS